MNRIYSAFRLGVILIITGLAITFFPEVVKLGDIAQGFVFGFVGTGLLLLILKQLKLL